MTTTEPIQSTQTVQAEKPKKNKKGRPSKALVESNKKGNRVARGRPAGDAARINEFKARLLSSSGTRVIDKVLQIAQDDAHPGQMAALKMCIDRLLPTSLFEKDARSKGAAVTINIVNASETSIQPSDEVFDVEAREVLPDEE